jgi:hypothetical protein
MRRWARAASLVALLGAGFLSCGGEDFGHEGEDCFGGTAGACDALTYCDLYMGACPEVDGGGVCRARPLVCPDVVEPVCTCSGKVYDNACEAQRAGESVTWPRSCGLESP